MSGSTPQHYLKGEPQLALEAGGQTFSYFYDYDQRRDHKLSGLTDQQKVLWFTKRIEITFLAPLRAIFLNPPSSVFNELMDTTSAEPRSFSIAIMSVMLNGIEAMGSFLEPDEVGNQERFNAFIKEYLPTWWRKPVSGGNPDITTLLWKCFRNGVAHGFQITPPGSLEFLKAEAYRWEFKMKVVQVCPLHFFKDLDLGMRSYCSDLESKEELLGKFIRRFQHVYPS